MPMNQTTSAQENADISMLTKLTNTELFQAAKDRVKVEEQSTLKVLNALREIDRRRAFAEKSYPDLLDFCTGFLGYRRGAAYRRILAMRALKSLPEIEEKIHSGSLTLTKIAQAQSYFNDKARENKPLNVEQKREIIKTLEEKSTRETEKFFLEVSPSLPPKESLKAISQDTYKWEVALPIHVKELIDQYRELLGPEGNNLENIAVIEKALTIAINETSKRQAARERSTAQKQMANPKNNQQPQVAVTAHTKPSQEVAVTKNQEAGETNQRTGQQSQKVPALELFTTARRYIPARTKKTVWQKNEGQCAHVDPATGLRCPAKTRLEIDHIKPFALDGTSEPENLRLLCKAHNQLAAIKHFGLKKMERYLAKQDLIAGERCRLTPDQ